jgi:hypothetical protein
VDGKPLPYARVEAFPGTVATSDASGNFLLVTTPGGPNSFTATRTFIDSNGSVSGMPGAKVIEFGKVQDDLLAGVSVPCSSVRSVAPSALKSLFTTKAATSKIVIKVGNVGLLSYQVIAMLTSGTVVASLYETLSDGTKGAGVTGAVMVLQGPSSSITLTEMPGNPGSYYATTTITPGARYSLTIDADHNGSIDGTGTVTAVGALAMTTPASGSTIAASTFTNAAWTDSASAASGYSVVYFASLAGSAGSATYMGSSRQFVPLNITNGSKLPAGSYNANLIGFSGPYSAGGNWTLTNNISGSTVSGKFISSSSAATTFILN